MRNLRTLTAAMVILVSPCSWAQQASSEIKTWRTSLLDDIKKWDFSTDEANSQGAALIRDKYGFRVSCDRGLYGVGADVTSDNCGFGLVRLETALKTLKYQADPENRKSIIIRLGKPGVWQGITYDEREFRIPYNANSQLIAKFMDSKMKVAFDSSLSNLTQSNRALAKKIKAAQFATVVADLDLDPYQIQEGLKKVELALNLAYDGKTPSQAEFAKLGFDTIVLAKSPSALYQDNGELRTRVNYADHEGKMFEDLIKAVAKPKPEDRHLININYASMLREHYTWADVVRFRNDRDQALRMASDLKVALKDADIRCQLDSSLSRAVDMGRCAKGLETLKSTVANIDKSQNLKDVRKIEVANFTYGSSDYQKDSKSLVVGYDATPQAMSDALRE